ncbi:Hsp20/alpha crystallin family protein [Bacillus manliponensis]|uniref:Hsp20/alpha crystallin family protein n=1 Tax=Bacillus manliponensis TaxID=574376 RepID=UPI00351142E6
MGKKKEKDCLFHVDGFEEWMNQFCSDSYVNSQYTDTFHVDLFETDEEYILEANIPEVIEKNILITKLETGLHIQLFCNNSFLQRTISLPTNIIDKKMLACLEHHLLNIHISKTTQSDNEETQISFQKSI